MKNWPLSTLATTFEIFPEGVFHVCSPGLCMSEHNSNMLKACTHLNAWVSCTLITFYFSVLCLLALSIMASEQVYIMAYQSYITG